MTAAKRARALTVRLDSKAPWEALLERRLETLAPAQRSRWIRGLLIAGFREECLVRSKLAPEGSTLRPRRPRWGTQTNAVIIKPEPSAGDRGEVSRSSKPLARLQRVIG